MPVITKIEPVGKAAVKKKRVAAYCRVSTDSDKQLLSLETQKSHYEETIGANPEWEFAGLYYDEGISGTRKETRPALMRMITDCENGKIDYIVTKSLSRFARNTTDCLELVRKLIGLGIPVYFEKENLDTGSMESELLLSIMSSLAESESVSISENSKWSVRHRFENGTFKIGYAPFGYDVKDGVFSINETEAETVRFIYAEALSGKSSGIIARDLNERCVPARKGAHWTPTAIRNVLTNEKYVGDCLFQKTYSDFTFKRRTNYGEMDQFYMENHHEAIVSREDFETVGQLIRQRAKEKNIQKRAEKYQNRYAFSSRIICGECGSVFRRRINITGKIRYPAWVCKEHIEHIENCSMRFIREDAIEWTFVLMMNKLIFAREKVLQDLQRNIRKETHKEIFRKVDEIDAALEKNREKRETLTTIMTKGYIEPAMFTQEMNALSAEADALTDEREQLISSVDGDTKKAEALNEIIRFTGRTEKLTEYDPEVFSAFVEQITVHSREELTFHLKCGLNLRERIVEV